jgi:hypothetical protein
MLQFTSLWTLAFGLLLRLCGYRLTPIALRRSEMLSH